MTKRSTAASIDEYIAGFLPATQEVLQELRALIGAAAPGATETISYAIPTFDLGGRHLVHFAGYAKHIGFYPVPSGIRVPAERVRRAPLRPARERRSGGPWVARSVTGELRSVSCESDPPRTSRLRRRRASTPGPR